MSVRIITDSTVDLPESYKKQALIVPLTIHFGEEEYLDGVTMSKTKFYEKLVESSVLPTTSQATPAAFESVYEEVTRNGDSAVVITISAKLSGTYQSACIAAEDYPNIFVVDSQSAAVGSGILAEFAMDCAADGMPADLLAKLLEVKREDICVIALLDTLEYLKKGGRISKTAAFAGSILNIKPVVTIQDGEVALIGKARGSKQGNNLLVEKIKESGGIDFTKPILLGYTGLTDVLLKKYIEDSRNLWAGQADSLDQTLICSVIGTHVGPGAVAAAFFKQQ